MQKKVFLYLSCLAFLFSISFYSVSAFEAQSQNYKLTWGNLNDFSGNKSSANYNLTDTGGQTAPGLYQSANYKTMAGFEYLYSIIPFSFSLSNNNIDFGTLSPNSPKTDTTDLTVSSGAAHGYKVTVRENHQLQRQGETGVYIQDATGDNSDITYQNAGAWNLNSTYGFGYTLANIIGTDAVFSSGYKQFADESITEEPQSIMQKNGVARESKVQLTYKVNVNALQEAGTYQNIITYICT